MCVREEYVELCVCMLWNNVLSFCFIVVPFDDPTLILRLFYFSQCVRVCRVERTMRRGEEKFFGYNNAVF